MPPPPQGPVSARAPRPALAPPVPAAGARRRSRWVAASPLLISVGFHGGLLALFGLILWNVIPPEPERVVDFLPSSRGDGRDGGGSPQTVPQRSHAPPLPQASLARVSAYGAAAELELPAPPPSDAAFAGLPALGGAGGGGFGSGSGTGAGLGGAAAAGLGGTSGLAGGGGGKALFFEQQVSAERVVYVIDYSGSMSGERSRLMRSELAKSVSLLTPMMRFQLIFFAGPTWIAGEEVTMIKDREDDPAPRSAEVVTAARTYRWENKGRGVWEPNRRLPRPEWRMVDAESIRTAVTQIQKTPFKYGGYWVAPLELALSMDPPPNVIYFMTDGASSDNTKDAMRDVVRHAKARKTVINTIAMMEPEAEEGMKELARATGGQFTVVEPGGKVTVVDLE